MRDVTEQLERYGEAVERSIHESTGSRSPEPVPMPTEQSRRVLRAPVLAAALAVILVVVLGVVAALRITNEPVSVNEPAGPPSGPPVAHLRIEALPSLSYQASEFTTIAGINEIELVAKGSTHTLVFDDPKLSYFGLSVPQGPTVGKARLQAGRDYRMGDVIAGHRAAGMKAVIHVLSVAELRKSSEPPDGCSALELPRTSGGCEIPTRQAERFLGFDVLRPTKVPPRWRVIRRIFWNYQDVAALGAPATEARVYNRVWSRPGTDLDVEEVPFFQLRVREAWPGETVDGPEIDLGSGRIARGYLPLRAADSTLPMAQFSWLEGSALYYVQTRGMTEVQIRTALASLRSASRG